MRSLDDALRFVPVAFLSQDDSGEISQDVHEKSR